MAATGNEDQAKFYCTKHSWRGRYVLHCHVCPVHHTPTDTSVCSL